jgi:excisionase family DNA binding protein
MTPLTVAQVARILGYAKQTITSYLRKKLLPGWRMGTSGSWRIDPKKFRELVDQMRKGIDPFVSGFSEEAIGASPRKE